MKLQGNEEKEWDFKKILMKNQVNFKDCINEEKGRWKGVENYWKYEKKFKLKGVYNSSLAKV